MTTDTEKIAQIRQMMPAAQNKVYLNTGTCGPLATLTTDAMNQANTLELAEGRAELGGFKLLGETMNNLRAAFARLVKAGPAEIALTHHTTEGMNIVAHGLSWQPGDEIVTTTSEHEGGLLPVYALKQRHGVGVKVIDITPDEVLAQLGAAITPRTRLLVISHVLWNTGARLPLNDIVALAHRRNILVLVDGAQSAGAIPLDLPASGVDFYALPGQKWLCGPEGTGVLYVRQDRLCLVAPTFVGFSTLEDVNSYDFTGYFLPARDSARRYEVGTIYRPGIKGMLANLTWLEETVGWDWIYARIELMADYARTALSTLPGVTDLTPPGPQAGLVTFNVAGLDPAKMMVKLAQEGIILRFIRHPYALRISTGFYNTKEDIDRLVVALQNYRRE
ncbi:MAG: aminotransferase class V-fold PLP-dependent enzyme [Anaerolineae bacterium]|nr:aminotransferase class V-fold PLP-dependent enzyme [Anaerolineae bacterium]